MEISENRIGFFSSRGTTWNSHNQMTVIFEATLLFQKAGAMKLFCCFQTKISILLENILYNGILLYQSYLFKNFLLKNLLWCVVELYYFILLGCGVETYSCASEAQQLLYFFTFQNY